MAIRVVAFDLDDTLWPVKPVLLRSESILGEHLWQMHGLDYSRERIGPLRDQLLAQKPQLAGMVTQFRLELLRRLFLDAGQNAETAAQNAERAFQVFLRARNQVTFFAGALDALAELKADYQLGSLSNGNADIRMTALAGIFSFSFSAEEVGAAKPDPALFQAALRATGVQAHEMVYVGDDPELDVQAAAAAGLRTVWANHQSRRFSGSTPADGSIESMRELPALIRSLI